MVVDENCPSFDIQVMRETQCFQFFESDHRVGFAWGDDGRVDFFSEADVSLHAPASLRDAVNFGLLRIVSRVDGGERGQFSDEKRSLPASQTARDLGDARMANVVMLGALSTLLPIEQEVWEKTLKLRIPAKYLDGNLKAFESGYDAMQKAI